MAARLNGWPDRPRADDKTGSLWFLGQPDPAARAALPADEAQVAPALASHSRPLSRAPGCDRATGRVVPLADVEEAPGGVRLLAGSRRGAAPARCGRHQRRRARYRGSPARRSPLPTGCA
jgi:hypothetical protein